MKVSARNVFSGTIKALTKGPVSTEVTVNIAPGIDVVAAITTTSANELGLKVGSAANVMIKASNVIVGVNE